MIIVTFTDEGSLASTTMCREMPRNIEPTCSFQMTFRNIKCNACNIDAVKVTLLVAAAV